MRRFLFLIVAFMIFFSFYIGLSLQAQEEGEVELAVENYFEYLKRGDTQGVLNLLTDPLLSERRELLEGNTAYPEFLRERYENAYMEVKNTEKIKGNERAIDMEIYLGEQEPPLKTRFILRKKSGSWKISEEINDEL